MNETPKKPIWRRWRYWILGVVAALVLVFVGGPFVYINFIKDDAPQRLTFEDATTTTRGADATTSTAATGSSPATTSTAATTPSTLSTGAAASGTEIAGAWSTTQGSQVGYRVKEVLFGQSTEGVGRTEQVNGQLTIAGTQVTAGSFTVDMSTVTSDEDRRDGQFRGRIMDTSTYPEATLVLTQPIDLGSVPANLAEMAASATGDLTLRGVTKPVTFDLKARRNGANIEVNGSIPVAFSDWTIPNPTTAGITTEDHGELEFLLVFNRV